MFDEFDSYADQIASDIPARDGIGYDEATRDRPRCYFQGEPQAFIRERRRGSSAGPTRR